MYCMLIYICGFINIFISVHIGEGLLKDKLASQFFQCKNHFCISIQPERETQSHVHCDNVTHVLSVLLLLLLCFGPDASEYTLFSNEIITNVKILPDMCHIHF